MSQAAPFPKAKVAVYSLKGVAFQTPVTDA